MVDHCALQLSPSYVFSPLRVLRLNQSITSRKMSAAAAIAIILVLSAAAPAPAAAQGGAIGVNYGRVADNLPPPETVASFVKSQGIPKVRIFDTDAAALAALAAQGIPVAVTIANGDIATLAASQESAAAYAARSITPFASTVSLVVVGNEVIKYSPELAPQLVPAMRNLRSALAAAGASALVSTATAMDVLDGGFPPSQGVFRSDAAATMRDLLDFLKQEGAPLLINPYPFFAYRDDAGRNIELAYALLDEGTARPVEDKPAGLHYSTMLDAQLDTVYAAMAKLGHTDVGLLVSETGWAWCGGFGAPIDNAAAFNRNLLRIVKSGRGTPARPQTPIQAYIFSLFNENQKPGGDSEQCFGVFNADMSNVYAITF